MMDGRSRSFLPGEERRAFALDAAARIKAGTLADWMAAAREAKAKGLYSKNSGVRESAYALEKFARSAAGGGA